MFLICRNREIKERRSNDFIYIDARTASIILNLHFVVSVFSPNMEFFL